MTKWEQQQLIEMIRNSYEPSSRVRAALGQLADAIGVFGERAEEKRERHLANMREMFSQAESADWKGKR